MKDCYDEPLLLFHVAVTLGQFETQGEAKTLMALVQDRFKDFEISVNHVYLLSRPDKGSQVQHRALRLKKPRR